MYATNQYELCEEPKVETLELWPQTSDGSLGWLSRFGGHLQRRGPEGFTWEEGVRLGQREAPSSEDLGGTRGHGGEAQEHVSSRLWFWDGPCSEDM